MLDGDGKVLKVWSIRTRSGDWREAFWDVQREVEKARNAQTFDRVVIENVGWYGSRKGIYNLNKLIGALWAWLVLADREVILVMPSEKIKLNKTNRRKVKNEHEADAISLGLTGIKRKWAKPKEKKVDVRTQYPQKSRR